MDSWSLTIVPTLSVSNLHACLGEGASGSRIQEDPDAPARPDPEPVAQDTLGWAPGILPPALEPPLVALLCLGAVGGDQSSRTASLVDSLVCPF